LEVLWCFRLRPFTQRETAALEASAAFSPVTMRAAALRSPLLGLLWLGLFD
jgi:hypothetical protein